MDAPRIEQQVKRYINDLKQSNTEEARKLQFQSLVTRLFGESSDAAQVISRMSQGAERTVFNIPMPGRLKTGFADIQYNNVIIEWEKSLARTGKHAEDQLAEYAAGNRASGNHLDFTLIATDGDAWRVYAPRVDQLLSETLPSRLALRAVAEINASKSSESDFYFFLDRHLFHTQQRRATMESIEVDFGDGSVAFRTALQTMQRHLPDFSAHPEVKTAFTQWQRFLQIAYGRFNDSRNVFFVHTYLSVFAKLLAFAVLAPNEAIDHRRLRGVLTGDEFKTLNVERFVEGDFFHWVALPGHFEALGPLFRDLLNRIAEYDFSSVEQDVLKGVYQELIDIDTRHQLGEYYTPDWLCERVVDAIHLEKEAHVLDPACGSGSFLRAVVAKLKSDYPDLSAERIAEQVVGIDIHPLSVQIAKTTLLLALGDSVRKAKRPIALRIYLANSLFLAEGAASLIGNVFRVNVDGHRLPIDISPYMADPAGFDKAVALCQTVIDVFPNEELGLEKFIRTLRGTLRDIELIDENASEMYEVYRAMRDARVGGRDTIWKFVLQNLYKPVFMWRAFDVVVGNPPWLTYSDVTSGDYQEELFDLAKRYRVKPSQANMPHLEIAALFLAHSGKYFLREGGQIAFVMPRSFLTADQHDRTRTGEALGFKLTEIWDMDVQPLFNVPSCVLFAQAWHGETVSDESLRPLPANGIVGKVWSGHLRDAQCHWPEAEPMLAVRDVRWYMQRMKRGKGSRSALVTQKIPPSSGELQGNAYADQFKQGATIVPRSFYFVELTQDAPDLHDRIVAVRNSRALLREAKEPWKSHTLAGRIHTRFLFRTALAKNILPFALINPPLVLLPMIVEDKRGAPVWRLKNHEELMAIGETDTAQWFAEASRLWNTHRTEQAVKSKMGLLDRLDYQRGLTGQPVQARYAVIYTSSAQNASAVVVDRDEFEQAFVVDYAGYVYFTEELSEATYLMAFFNSTYANFLIKQFQARGLFGPRHISKTILQIPFPSFDASNPLHQSLAALGAEAAIGAHRIAGSDPAIDLATHALGRMRRKIRVDLAPLLKLIDQLVEAISTGRETATPHDNALLNPVPTPFNVRSSEEIDAFITAERASWERS